MQRITRAMAGAALGASLVLTGCNDAADTEVDVPEVDVPETIGPDVQDQEGGSGEGEGGEGEGG